jgi:hypothetical protein
MLLRARSKPHEIPDLLFLVVSSEIAARSRRERSGHDATYCKNIAEPARVSSLEVGRAQAHRPVASQGDSRPTRVGHLN